MKKESKKLKGLYLKKKMGPYLKGFASIMDFGGVLSQRPAFLDKTDEEAIREDWEAVWGDFNEATKKFQNEF
jgi:hypothetical protein